MALDSSLTAPHPARSISDWTAEHADNSVLSWSDVMHRYGTDAEPCSRRSRRSVPAMTAERCGSGCRCASLGRESSDARRCGQERSSRSDVSAQGVLSELDEASVLVRHLLPHLARIPSHPPWRRARRTKPSAWMSFRLSGSYARTIAPPATDQGPAAAMHPEAPPDTALSRHPRRPSRTTRPPAIVPPSLKDFLITAE